LGVMMGGFLKEVFQTYVIALMSASDSRSFFSPFTSILDGYNEQKLSYYFVRVRLLPFK
jgi:hypothetical protein